MTFTTAQYSDDEDDDDDTNVTLDDLDGDLADDAEVGGEDDKDYDELGIPTDDGKDE